jgi:hypothetical protein
MYSSITETRNHVFENEPAVETVTELRQIAWQMFFTDSMIGTVNRILQISDHRIDPGECLQCDTGRTTTGYDCLMLTTCILYRTKTLQSIGDTPTSRAQMTFRPLADLLFTEAFYSGETHRDGVTLFIGLYRGDERCFTRCATTPLATSAFASPVGIIQLDLSQQRLAVVTFLHYLKQLVLHTPGCVVANTQLPLEFQCRNTVLRLCQDVHPEEPGRQRQLGVLENGSTCQRGLVMTAMTLIQVASGDNAVTVMPAYGAGKTFWPAPFEKCLAALLFCTIVFQKFWQTEPSLKLNLIFSHDFLLALFQVQYP